jgi:hypothetical protein
MTQTAINSGGDVAGLAAIISRASEQKGDGTRKPAPVERWNPAFCGDLDMEIRADGTWFYMGTPIGRMPLVQLFASVLRKDEDGKTYLVTPVEKVGIRVADAHFLAVELAVSHEAEEQVITLRTNLGDLVTVGKDNPLRFAIEGDDKQLKPYVLVRGRLEALVTRALTYDLVALGEVVQIDNVDMFVLKSGGEIFPIMRADELDALSP